MIVNRDSNFSRREFLKSVSRAALLAGLPFHSLCPFSWVRSFKRRDSQNPFLRDGKPLLVVVEGNNLRMMLEAGFKSLPEFEAALKNRKRIVLKPNATAAEPYPVTTDVGLLKELLVFVKQYSRAQLSIMDSTSYAGLTAYRIFSKLGYFSLGKEENVRVLSIDPTLGSYFRKVKSLSWEINPSFLTNSIIQESDFIINLAIPKRHHTADFTCGLKNNFGCTYDSFRMSAHAKAGKKNNKGEKIFDQSLVEFADAVRPELTIIDARSILIKSGPTFRPSQSEIKNNVNRLIICGDMVATDAYCAELLAKYDESFEKEMRLARQLAYAERLGLGIKDLSQVEIIEVTA